MQKSFTILIVDDSQTIVHFIIDILDKKMHNLLFTYSREEAKRIIQQNEIDILITDLMMPHLSDGLEIVDYFRRCFPAGKTLVISAFPETENVVLAIRAGADDFIPKSSTKDQILKKIEEFKTQINMKNGFHYESLLKQENDLLIGESQEIVNIKKQIEVIAENEVEACLVVGESGTGKELVAKTIHELSPRKKKPFIALNCAGIPDNLIDSELFGFEKGSFTGAYQTTIGKFELAQNGILFLDEISEMPIHLQAKLLRVLENREIVRIGGRKNIPVDVMILASSNQNLPLLIRQGTFREDIYYRLNLVNIIIPPLRERKSDIPLLVNYFLQRVSRKMEREVNISPKALRKLVKYHFPGNVRELKNFIFTASLFTIHNLITEIEVEKYLDAAKGNDYMMPPVKQNIPIDDSTILEVLRKNQGNITQTAKDLGYSREGLSRKLKKMRTEINIDL